MANETPSNEPDEFLSSRPAGARRIIVPTRFFFEEKPSLARRSVDRFAQALNQTFGSQALTNLAAGKGISGAVQGVSPAQAVAASAGAVLGGPVGLVGGSFLGSLLQQSSVQERPEEVLRRLGIVPTTTNVLAASILLDPIGAVGGFGIEKNFAISTTRGLRYVKDSAKPLMREAIQRVHQSTGLHPFQASEEVRNLLGQAISRPAKEIVDDPVLMQRLSIALGTQDRARIIQAIDFTRSNLAAKPSVRIAGKEIPGSARLEENRAAFVQAMKEKVRRSIEPLTPVNVRSEFLTSRAIRLRQAVEDAFEPKVGRWRQDARDLFERAVTNRGNSITDATDGPILLRASAKTGINIEGFLKEPSNVFLQGAAAKSTARIAKSAQDSIDWIARKFGLRAMDPELEPIWRDHLRSTAFGTSELRQDLAEPFRDLTIAERRAAFQIGDEASVTIVGIRNEVQRRLDEFFASKGGVGLLTEDDWASVRLIREAADSQVMNAYELALRELPGDLGQKTLRFFTRMRQLGEILYDNGQIREFNEIYARHLFRNPKGKETLGFLRLPAVQTDLRGAEIRRLEDAYTLNPIFATVGIARQVGLDPIDDIFEVANAVANDYVAALEGGRFLQTIAKRFGRPESDFIRTPAVGPDDLQGAIRNARAARLGQEEGIEAGTRLRLETLGLGTEGARELERLAKVGKVFEGDKPFAPQVAGYRSIVDLPEIEVTRPIPKKGTGLVPSRGKEPRTPIEGVREPELLEGSKSRFVRTQSEGKRGVPGGPGVERELARNEPSARELQRRLSQQEEQGVLGSPPPVGGRIGPGGTVRGESIPPAVLTGTRVPGQRGFTPIETGGFVEFRDPTGTPLPKTATDLVESLEKYAPPSIGPSRRVSVDIQYGKDFQVVKERVRIPSEIATALHDLAPSFVSPDGVAEVSRLASALTDLFKASVTINPFGALAPFTVKQVIGNTFNSMLGIGVRALNPFEYLAAYRIAFTKVKDTWLTDFGPYSFDEVRRFAEEQDLYSGLGIRLQLSQAAQEQKGAVSRIRQAGLRREVLDRGLFQTVRGVAQDIASFPDKIARTMLFMHFLRDGLDPVTAGIRSRMFVHDLTALAPFEMRWMRSIVPFYAWPRRNIPLQLRSMMEKPRIASVTLHSFQASGPGERERRDAPGYLLDQLNVAMGRDERGRPLLLGNFNLPIEDLLRLIPSDGWQRVVQREVFGRLNPLIQIPLEQATGRVFFTGREIGARTSVPEFFASIPGLSHYLDVRQERVTRGERRYSADADRVFWIQGFVFSRMYSTLVRSVNPDVPVHWKLLDLFSGIRPDVVDFARGRNDRLVRELQRMDDAGLLRHGKYYYGARTPEARRLAKEYNSRGRGKSHSIR